MLGAACNKAGCTVADTGTCLLSNPAPRTCPHFRQVDQEEDLTRRAPVSAEGVDAFSLPGLPARRFPAGLELGLEDAAEIMRARYASLIGILGSWDAGKTCYLLSLYLMASRASLPPKYIFAGSRTLQGFEDRARRLREWSGGPLPEQLADHTSLADPRRPALLHLALRETTGAKRLMDLLLTDLPGEWSKNLVDRADTAERFMFLRRADGIMLVIDGPRLDSTAQHSELQRSKHLLERLVHAVGVDITTPLILLVSKCDRINMKRPRPVDEIEEHARSLGFKPQVVMCAAFSLIPATVPNGVGVMEALEKILVYDQASHQGKPFIPDEGGERMFSRFR
jgi:hypothetical protein